MKSRLESPTRSSLAATAFATAILAGGPALAADQTYDDTSFSDFWNLTEPNWDASAAPWTNGNNAIFGGTGEFVSVNAAVTAGNLTFNSNGYTIAPGTGSLALANAGNIATVTDAAHTATISIPVDGTGKALTKAGAGTLVLDASNSYDGGTTISAGTLQLGSGASDGLLATTGDIVNNGTLAINRSNAVVQGTDFSPNPITGSGSLVKLGTGTLFLNAANAHTGGTTITAGTLQLGEAGATGSLPPTGSLAIASTGTLAIDRSNAVVQGTDFTASPITGSGGKISLIGPGSLTLNAANTYSGATTIGANSGGLILTSGLAIQKSTLTGNRAEPVTFASGIGTFTLGGLAGNYNLLTLADTAAAPVTLNLGGNNFNATSNAILTGAGGLVKSGTATQTLTPSTTVACNGTSGTNSLTLLDARTILVGQVVSGTGVPTNVTVTVTAVSGLNVTLSANLSGNITGGNVTFAGSSFTGGVDVQGGTIFYGAANAFGTGTLSFANGTNLRNAASVNMPNNIVLNGNITIGSGGASRLYLGGSIDLAGTAPTNGSAGTTRTVTYFRNNTAANMHGTTGNEAQQFVSGANPAPVTNGTLRLAADASVTAGNYAGIRFQKALSFPGNGGLTVANQVITFAAASPLFTATTTATVPRLTVESGGVFMCTENTNSRSVTVFSLAGSGTVGAADSNGGTSTLAIAGDDTTTFSGVIADGTSLNTPLGIPGNAAAILNLARSGTGTQILTGANTYQGTTTVSGGGKLIINNTSGSGTGTGAVSVTSAPGTTLGGSGTVAGAVTINGNIAPGSVAPDPLTGTLTTGAVDLNGNLVVEINGASADKLVSTGAIDLTGSTLLVSELAGGFTAPSYVIAEGTSITGTFATVPAGYNVSYTGTQAILTKVAAAGYDSWKTLPANGLTAGVNDGVNDDPDFDGISNLLEFVLGGIPAGAGAADPSILPAQSLTPTTLVLDFDRDELSDGDVTLKVQWSNDLATWGSPNEVTVGAASAGIVTVTENGAAPDTIQVAIPRGSNTRLFARVLVTRP